jgi:hypothetical protein
MAVSVDHPGGRGASVQVDDAGCLSCQLHDLSVGPDGNDPAPADSERLSDSVLRIDSQDGAVDEHHVGLLGAQRRAVAKSCGEQGKRSDIRHFGEYIR